MQTPASEATGSQRLDLISISRMAPQTSMFPRYGEDDNPAFKALKSALRTTSEDSPLAVSSKFTVDRLSPIFPRVGQPINISSIPLIRPNYPSELKLEHPKKKQEIPSKIFSTQDLTSTSLTF
jgi:hypothetical protein